MLAIYIIDSGILFQCGEDYIPKSIHSYTGKIECSDLSYVFCSDEIQIAYTTDNQKGHIKTNGKYIIETTD